MNDKLDDVMARTRSRFTQTEIARALRAIAQSKLNYEVKVGLDGVIHIVKTTCEEENLVDEKRRIEL